MNDLSFGPVHEYFHIQVTVWRSEVTPTQAPIQPLGVVHKGALRTAQHVGYQEHTNSSFSKSNTLNCMDLAKLKTAQTMYKVRLYELKMFPKRVFII